MLQNKEFPVEREVLPQMLTEITNEVKKYFTDENALRFEFVDEGELYDPPKKIPDVDIESEMTERQVGGLGIFLYTTIMDKLEYRCEDGKNHLPERLWGNSELTFKGH